MAAAAASAPYFAVSEDPGKYIKKTAATSAQDAAAAASAAASWAWDNPHRKGWRAPPGAELVGGEEAGPLGCWSLGWLTAGSAAATAAAIGIEATALSAAKAAGGRGREAAVSALAWRGSKGVAGLKVGVVKGAAAAVASNPTSRAGPARCPSTTVALPLLLLLLKLLLLLLESANGATAAAADNADAAASAAPNLARGSASTAKEAATAGCCTVRGKNTIPFEADAAGRLKGRARSKYMESAPL